MRERDQQFRRERGATALEYGLILTGVAVAIIAGVIVFGQSVAGLFALAWRATQDLVG